MSKFFSTSYEVHEGSGKIVPIGLVFPVLFLTGKNRLKFAVLSSFWGGAVKFTQKEFVVRLT